MFVAPIVVMGMIDFANEQQSQAPNLLGEFSQLQQDSIMPALTNMLPFVYQTDPFALIMVSHATCIKKSNTILTNPMCPIEGCCNADCTEVWMCCYYHHCKRWTWFCFNPPCCLEWLTGVTCNCWPIWAIPTVVEQIE